MRTTAITTVTITAFDDNGGALTPQTITIHVNNVAPTLTLTSNSYSVDEGSVMSIPDLARSATQGSRMPPIRRRASRRLLTGSIGATGQRKLVSCRRALCKERIPTPATPELTIPS